MKTVAQLLKPRSTGIVAISADVTVLDAIKLLAEKNVGVLLVMRDPRLVRLFSERDYVRKVNLNGKSSANTPVGAGSP